MRTIRYLSAAAGIGALAALLYLEKRRPLRREVEPKLDRLTRNLAMAGMGAVVVQLAEWPVAQLLSSMMEPHGWGLLPHLRFPAWVAVPVAILLLDYTLYIWHVLTHRVPFLWRFHLVHHVDLDLDASTALRFHAGELACSVPFRAAQVLVIGVSPLALSLWQGALLISIVFHHSNLRLPEKTERWLNWFIVTPRMHGIHHSIVRSETNSNWSNGLSLWDRLHKTFRMDIPQEEITIGVPAYRDPAEVTLPKLLAMPFREQRADWLLPGGAEPVRG